MIVSGEHQGRIGNLDDEEGDAVIYFGDMLFAPGYFMIPFKRLRIATTQDLRDRLEVLFNTIGLRRVHNPEAELICDEDKICLYSELAYVQSQLLERLTIAMMTDIESDTGGKKIFISHSSKDKAFAVSLSTDLRSRGHSPWLDSWNILAGESIPEKVNAGLSECDYVVVVLSNNSVQSNWVEREWQSRYWDEVNHGRVVVIRILLESCNIPTLLAPKKYADFGANYNDGLDELLMAIK